MVTSQRIERFPESDKVARDQACSLVNQLIERVLAVGSRLAPVNGARRIVNFAAGFRDVLAIAFHGELLKIGRKTLEVLLVGQHRDSLCAEKVGVPETEQAENHG